MIEVRFKRLLYFILIIFFIVDTALPISQEGKAPVQLPSSLVGGRENPGALAGANTGSAPTTTTPRVSIEPPREDSDGGPSLQPAQKTVTISSANDSTKVVKVITPRTNKTGRRMGEFAKVGVEIQSMVNETITISIREIINENLRIFKSTEHGYILSNEDEICYYKLGFLDDLESGRLKATIKDNNGDKLLTFKEGNCTISVRELIISDYAFREPSILIWPPEKNDSLKNSYFGLREFLEYKLAFNKSMMDNLTINCTHDINVSIKNKDKYILGIVNNETCLMDKCPVLLWNNIPHHLVFKEINNTRHVYDTLNILAFDEVVLSPYSTFVFWYHVMPNNPGIYDTETLVTLKETENSRTISSHLELEILEDSPQFDVHRKFNKNQIYQNDELDFEFDVDYRGGGAEPEIKNVPIRFNPSNDYEYIIIDGKDIRMDSKKNSTVNLSRGFYKNFVKDKTVPISVTIKFNKTGILSPPSIWINDRHFIFDANAANVTVDIPLWRYFNLINLLLIAIGYGVIFLVKEIYLETDGRRNTFWTRIIGLWDSLFGIIIKITLVFSIPLILLFLVRWLLKI